MTLSSANKQQTVSNWLFQAHLCFFSSLVTVLYFLDSLGKGKKKQNLIPLFSFSLQKGQQWRQDPDFLLPSTGLW